MALLGAPAEFCLPGRTDPYGCGVRAVDLPLVAPSPHRLIEALQRHLTFVHELELFAGDGLADDLGDENAAALGFAFELFRDDHGHAGQVAVGINDGFPCVDADMDAHLCTRNVSLVGSFLDFSQQSIKPALNTSSNHNNGIVKDSGSP